MFDQEMKVTTPQPKTIIVFDVKDDTIVVVRETDPLEIRMFLHPAKGSLESWIDGLSMDKNPLDFLKEHCEEVGDQLHPEKKIEILGNALLAIHRELDRL